MRSTCLKLLSLITINLSGHVGVPRQLVITGDAASIPGSVARAGLRLPLGMFFTATCTWTWYWLLSMVHTCYGGETGSQYMLLTVWGSFSCNNATMGGIRKLSLLTIVIWPFVQLQSHWWQMEQQSRMRCHWLMISTAWQSWTPLLFYKNLSITVLAMPYHLFAWLLFTHFKLRITWPHVHICHSH